MDYLFIIFKLVIYPSSQNMVLSQPSMVFPESRNHSIRVAEQGNYHVIVYHVYSGEQHPMISMLFIP